MTNRLLIAGLLACLGTATTSLAADVAAGNVDAAQAFRTANPEARFYLTGQRITSVYGKAFSQGTSAIDSVERFLAANSRMLGVENADLVPGSLAGDNAHVHEMVPTENGGSKFTLVSYLQYKDGIQVFRGNVRLLTRNEAGSPLVLVRSGLRPVEGFAANAEVAGEPNVGAAFEEAMLRFPGMINFSAPDVMVWAGVDDAVVAPRLAIVFTGSSGDANNPATYQKHLIVADAATGAMIWSENQIHNVDITGSVKGMTTQSYRADACDPEALTALPYARVTVGATQYFADANGNFTIPNSGTTSVAVGAMVRGRWFRVLNSAGAEATQTQNVLPPGPANFVFNAANTSEHERAEVNAYLQANIVRDYLLQYSPNFPTIVNQQSFTTNVNIADACNAFYDGGSINFFHAQGGCNNTAFGTVVHHEYGHHIVNRAGSGQGAYGEGFGDLMGVLVTDDPRLGMGMGGCNSPMRNAANNRQYPCSGAIHDCGQLLSGCFWSTRNELLATNPSTYRAIVSTLATNSVLLHDGTVIDPQITIDVLTIDDNNANISDGTPHYQEIAAGFGVHNMDAPPLVVLTYSYPAGRPSGVNPAGGTAFQVQITGQNGNILNPATATLHLDPENDGTYTQHALSHVGSGLFNVNFPATDCGSTVRYYLSAATTSGSVIRDPENAPTGFFFATSGESVTTTYSTNFANNTGWTDDWEGGTGVGAWDWGTPNATPTTGAVSGDFDGNNACYVTGNAGQNVGNGTASLLSPMMDASGAGEHVLSYARWFFTNGTSVDTFVVQASNDNGATWVNLETLVGGSANASGGWRYHSVHLSDFLPLTSQMRFRFRISDPNPSSTVEGGIDSVTLQIVDCGGDECAADFDGDGFVSGTDFDLYVAAFEAGELTADFDGDGFVTGSDFDMYVAAYEAGC